jgi:hypothetical protein
VFIDAADDHMFVVSEYQSVVRDNCSPNVCSVAVPFLVELFRERCSSVLKYYKICIELVRGTIIANHPLCVTIRVCRIVTSSRLATTHERRLSISHSNRIVKVQCHRHWRSRPPHAAIECVDSVHNYIVVVNSAEHECIAMQCDHC